MSLCPFNNFKPCNKDCALARSYDPDCEMEGSNLHCIYIEISDQIECMQYIVEYFIDEYKEYKGDE